MKWSSNKFKLPGYLLATLLVLAAIDITFLINSVKRPTIYIVSTLIIVLIGYGFKIVSAKSQEKKVLISLPIIIIAVFFIVIPSLIWGFSSLYGNHLKRSYNEIISVPSNASVLSSGTSSDLEFLPIPDHYGATYKIDNNISVIELQDYFTRHFSSMGWEVLTKPLGRSPYFLHGNQQVTIYYSCAGSLDLSRGVPASGKCNDHESDGYYLRMRISLSNTLLE